MYHKWLQKILLISFLLCSFTACDSIVQEEQRADLGEVWLNLNGSLYKYNVAGSFPENDNGYVKKIKFLSIIRHRFETSRNSVVIRIIPFDIDQKTPIKTNKVLFSIYFKNGAKIQGDKGNISLTIIDITDDILTGVYEGIAVDANNTAKKYRVSGSLKIKIQRF